MVISFSDKLISFSSAETVFDNGLAQSPELYCRALMQLAISENNEIVRRNHLHWQLYALIYYVFQIRSLSLVLLRRILFRPLLPQALFNPNAQSELAPPANLYGQLSADTLDMLEGLLLHSLSYEPSPTVRHKSIDTIAQFATNGIRRGRPWHALQMQAISMAQSAHAPERGTAFTLFMESPKLAMEMDTEAMIGALTSGINDAQSIDVRTHPLSSSHRMLVLVLMYLFWGRLGTTFSHQSFDCIHLRCRPGSLVAGFRLSTSHSCQGVFGSQIIFS